MTNVFTVIGEKRDEPDRLLVLGSNGQHDDYHLVDGPIAPDEAWVMDIRPLLIEDLGNEHDPFVPERATQRQ